MRPEAINSWMAAQRNHSLNRRWTCGSGTRRRSGRGGKSGPQASAHLALLALAHFQPDQKTVAQHYGDGVAMKTIPAQSLIVIPAQFGFSFLMILLDPVAAVGILNHRGPRCRGREITPEILPVPMLAATGALAEQPAHLAAAVTIDPPAAQCHKFGPPPALGPFTPGDGLPILARLRRQHYIGPLHRTGWPTPQAHTETGPYRGHVTFPACFQAIEEMRIIAVISIAGHASVLHSTDVGFIQQRQSKLRFSLKPDRSRDVRLLTPRLIGHPLLWQIQPGGYRPGQRALGIMTIDRDLAVGHFARRPAILAGHPDRVSPLLLKPRIIKDEHPIAFARQRLHLGDPLPVERALIPHHVGQQVVELLLVGLGYHLGQGVAVLVGMLTEKAGEILPQGLRTRPFGKMHAQR